MYLDEQHPQLENFIHLDEDERSTADLSFTAIPEKSHSAAKTFLCQHLQHL